MTEIRASRDYIADLAGRPLENGAIFYGIAGLDPELNPISVFWDAGMTSVATQPLTVTAGYIVHSGSRARIYTAAANWSERIEDKSGSQVSYDTTATALLTSSDLRTRIAFLQDYGAIPGSAADQTDIIEAAFAAALASGVGRVEGGGGTYYVTQAAVTIAGALTVDNMTLKEYAPNSGAPKTITFTAQTASTGSLYLGPNFKVDRSGNGLLSDLDNSAGIIVENVARVDAHCEVYGNAKGNGLWVKHAKWFYDNSYIHDMRCDHTGVTDDIQHGSWAWYCEYVVTRGLVQNLGNIDRTVAQRDRYNRGRAYSGCKNIDLGGSVGPGVDQSYDVTGDAANGNACVRINGAHCDYPFSSGVALKNATLASTSGCLTVREPGLCSVLVSGPAEALVNMSRWAMISGITQIGGGANQIWAPEASVVRLNAQGAGAPENTYPKGVRVTGNMYCWPEGTCTFTVADTDEMTPNLGTDGLNTHDCARVRLTTTGTLPTGLAIATDYWIALKEGGNFQLATSFIRAQDGLFITGLTGGSGTHTITIQNDVNYGCVSEVTAYDKEAPNLVYRNAFGPIIESQANIKLLRCDVTNASAQSVDSGSAEYLEASAKTDPYGIGTIATYIEFTAPFEGELAIVCNGEWAGGTAAGVQSTNLRIDTGSGFSAREEECFEQAPCPTVAQRQVLRWRGKALRNQKFRLELAQSSGSAKNYQLKALYMEYLP
jgi:hypothetical protein